MPTYTSDLTHNRLPRFSVQDRLRQAQDQYPYNLDDISYSLEEAENMDLRVYKIVTQYFNITYKHMFNKFILLFRRI